MKKFLTFLVAVMLLAMLPVYAFAAGSASVKRVMHSVLS